MQKNDHLHMPPGHMEALYNSKNPLVRFVHRQRLRAIASCVPHKPNQKVLDAGCGEGHLLRLLSTREPSNTYYGVDATPIALECAQRRCPSCSFALTDLASLPFPDNSFDVIMCTETIEHIFEFHDVLQEFKRTLKEGGLLIITFPNEVLWTLSRFLLRRNPVKVPDHVNSFTPWVLAKTLGLPAEKRINLPFRLPFFLSLGSLLVFRKR